MCSFLFFFQSRGKWELQVPSVHICPSLFALHSKVKDAARMLQVVREEQVCKIVDAAVSFKSNMWKCFGFPASRNAKDKQKTQHDYN